MDGDEVLVDPGRYTDINSSLRWELKNAISHNVSLGDREEYSKATGTWAFETLPISTPIQVISKELYTLIEGSHTRYCRKGITVNRRILVLDHEAIVVCDTFTGPKPKSITQRFHFGERIFLDAKDAVFHGYGEKRHFQLYSFADGHSISPLLEQGPFSGHYNQCSTIPVSDLTASGALALTSNLIRSGEENAGVVSVPVRNLVSGKT